jgi:ABC-2 type transport system ATP-binding protein
VAFKNAPEIDTLLQVSGVDHAEQLANDRIRIHYSAFDPAEALTEQSVIHRWRLYELAPERRTLEQIFIELTCSESPVHEDAA